MQPTQNQASSLGVRASKLSPVDSIDLLSVFRSIGYHECNTAISWWLDAFLCSELANQIQYRCFVAYLNTCFLPGLFELSTLKISDVERAKRLKELNLNLDSPNSEFALDCLWESWLQSKYSDGLSDLDFTQNLLLYKGIQSVIQSLNQSAK